MLPSIHSDLDVPLECKPLETPKQLFDWDQKHVHPDLKSSVGLSKLVKSEEPRLLACHDMRGGYLEDRFALGGTDASFYYFRHWHAIDLFVYFSHHLVTVPPVGWVNAGHQHGVLVLGTFITEWDTGSEYCRQLFGTLASAERTAAQLAAIAQSYGFDGWVINIENDLDLDQVPNVIHFLGVLRGLLHAVSPCSEVVWYDAVTMEGKLEWQDTLNQLNRPFFEASTALWVNYTWRESTPAEVRAEAAERRHDVFMGIDVFGRGTYGGGGYSSDIALSAAKAAGLSAALFAIGWPFEADPAPGDSPSWEERDASLWASVLREWCPERPVWAQLPFCTDFSVGCGYGTMHEGDTVSLEAWYNISRQGLQPALQVCSLDSWQGGSAVAPAATRAAAVNQAALPTEGTTISQRLACQPSLQAVPTLHLAYSGGSCIEISGRNIRNPALVRLYRTNIPVPQQGLEVEYVVAAGSGLQFLLALTLQTDSSHDSGHFSKQRASSTIRLLLASENSAREMEQWSSLSVYMTSQPAVLLAPSEVNVGTQLKGFDGLTNYYCSSSPERAQRHRHEHVWVRRCYHINNTRFEASNLLWKVASIDALVLTSRNSICLSQTSCILLGKLQYLV